MGSQHKTETLFDILMTMAPLPKTFLQLLAAIVTLLIVFFVFSLPAKLAPVHTELEEKSLSERLRVTQEGGKMEKGEKERKKLTLEELEKGCPWQDCVPSIDNPKFISSEEADTWLDEDEIVFGLIFKDEVKAYPKQILVWHEVVNDTVAGDPVLITFSTLSGTAAAFRRSLNGAETLFGVSGRLYNSNLILYDRSPEKNYWQQATGEAIIGPASEREEKLRSLPISTSTWKEWKTSHPETKVLSRDTGFTRTYGTLPYGNYEQEDTVYFTLAHTDTRLPPKEPVYGFYVGRYQKAYPASVLKDKQSLDDEIAGEKVVVTRAPDGMVVMSHTETGEVFIPLYTFWFAWAAFYPNSLLYTE